MKPPKDERRPLPGRPRRDDALQKRRNITLSDAYAEKAVEIGGSISEGIRQALDHYSQPERENEHKNA